MNVSTVIPVYNAAPFLKDAVQSALNQPQTAEVILVEDGSVDNSLQVCRQLESDADTVRLLRHPGGGNRGPGASRNRGIEAARNEFVAFLDADDYFLADRFATAEKVFDENPRADGVYEAIGTVFESENGRAQWWRWRGDETLTTIRDELPPERLFEALVFLTHGTFSTDGIVVKRSLFERTGLFDEDLMLHQDTAMWIKMAAVGVLLPGSIRRPVANRRVHDNNRILKTPLWESPYRTLLDERLCRWAEKKQLPKEHLRMLYYRKHRNHFFMYGKWSRLKKSMAGANTLYKTLRTGLFFAGRVVLSPQLLPTSFYPRLVVHGCRERFGPGAPAGARPPGGENEE